MDSPTTDEVRVNKQEKSWSHITRQAKKFIPASSSNKQGQKGSKPPARMVLIIDGLGKEWTRNTLGEAILRNLQGESTHTQNHNAIKHIHQLEGGGWVISLHREEIAKHILESNFSLTNPTTNQPETAVDIHRGGTPSRRSQERDKTTSLGLHCHLPAQDLKVLGDAWKEQALTKTEMDADFTTKCQLPTGTRLDVLNEKTGRCVLHCTTDKDREKVLGVGFGIPGTGIWIFPKPLVEKFRPPPFCHKCNELGHPTKSCKKKKEVCVCRSCGQVGHSEEGGKCPLVLTHPNHSQEEQHFCIHCRRHGHKAGSKLCPVWKRTIKAMSESSEKPHDQSANMDVPSANKAITPVTAQIPHAQTNQLVTTAPNASKSSEKAVARTAEKQAGALAATLSGLNELIRTIQTQGDKGEFEQQTVVEALIKLCEMLCVTLGIPKTIAATAIPSTPTADKGSSSSSIQVYTPQPTTPAEPSRPANTRRKSGSGVEKTTITIAESLKRSRTAATARQGTTSSPKNTPSPPAKRAANATSSATRTPDTPKTQSVPLQGVLSIPYADSNMTE